MLEFILAKYNYWIYILIMMIGLYAMLAKNNLIKKIIGMGIFQTAIIIFYVSAGAKRGGTIPIIEHAHGAEGNAVDVLHYINPLPHVLMLTAIVVSVGTLGVALALALRIYGRYNSLEEDEILDRIDQDETATETTGALPTTMIQS
ncbi:MAG: cation:proton antiporter subunit C [Proteobacteria bacterium]|nr:cation:proton antiporter subunit C [Pseudomonadota bacterium]MBU1688481.1 cation:proton antiporter subunit C [Pseudomonadota bacterium]